MIGVRASVKWLLTAVAVLSGDPSRRKFCRGKKVFLNGEGVFPAR